VVDAAVLDCAFPGPRVEHCGDRLPKLLLRILRERLAGLLFEELLELLREPFEVVDAELHVLAHARVLLLLLDEVLVALARDAAADVPEHLHEAPVGVPREALVAGGAGEALHGLVVQAEVEDRVEHARHRLAGAASDRYQQRVVGLAQLTTGLLLQAAEGGADLVARQLLAVHVPHAGLCGEREAGGHPLGAEHSGHLGDVRSLASQELAHVA
jgi:hypothetical protein